MEKERVAVHYNIQSIEELGSLLLFSTALATPPLGRIAQCMPLFSLL